MRALKMTLIAALFLLLLVFIRSLELYGATLKDFEYLSKGHAAADKGLYDEAVSNYSKAIELSPDDEEASYDRGCAYAGKKLYDQAISDFTKVIELDPKYAEAYNIRGDAYADKGEYNQAISDYTRAIELDPKDADPFNGRGYAYFKKGLYDNAISDYDEALKINPSYRLAQDNREEALKAKAKGENRGIGQPESEQAKGKDADKTLDRVFDQIISQAAEAAKNERTTETLGHGYLGTGVRTLTPALAEAYKLKEAITGALVIAVRSKSPAEKAGIENGDVITSIDTKKIGDAAQLRSMVSSMAPGTKVRIGVNHGGQEKLFDIDLAEIPVAERR